MIKSLIWTRFDCITLEGDRTILVQQLPAVPDPGEIVGVHGHPFVVHIRGWAVGNEKDRDSHALHCYLRLVPYKPLPDDFFQRLKE